MSDKYPRPDWAVSVWLSGHTLYVDLDSHTVQIPLDKLSIERNKSGAPLARQLGWYSLLNILHSRAALGYAPKIAKQGSPVQYDLEAMLKSLNKLKDAKEDEVLDILKTEGMM